MSPPVAERFEGVDGAQSLDDPTDVFDTFLYLPVGGSAA